MKQKIITYICLSVALFAGYSCDFLDKAPDDELTLEMVFRDKTRTEDWLAGIYNGIPSPYLQGKNNYDLYADDLSMNSGIEAYGGDAITKIRGNWNSESPWNFDFWGNLPKRIRSAHIFIANVQPNTAQMVTPEEVELMKAECRFLIAYFYYLLVNSYGAVPFQEGLADLATPVEELMTGQKPYNEMIDWIDAELQETAKLLPAYYTETRKYGRATSVMCLAVRARMLLFAASDLVNGNTKNEYVNYANNKGERIFDSQYRHEKWERAAKACKELIELAHDNGYGLYYEYNSDGSIDPFMSYANMSFKEFNQGNKEILFANPHCGDYGDYDKEASPYGSGGSGFMGVTQSLVDAFFMKSGRPPILYYQANGTPVFNPETASEYSETGFSTADETRTTKWIEAQGASANNTVNPVTNAGTYNMYCNREPRFYVSVRYNEQWYRVSNRKLNMFDGGPDNSSPWDSPENGYLLFKRVHPNTDMRGAGVPYRPGILYRLGEAYLNYAEALNEWDPSQTGEILFYLNEIRKRAGIPTYGPDAGQIPAPVGQPDMRAAIRRERRVEMNCEFAVRFDDIRRWKQVEELLSVEFYGMNRGATAANRNEFYVRTPYFKRGFTWKNYWMPIHQNQMDKNPDLRQLPGWSGEQ
ncbi:MAG: RagB/SusD family nutrient uptake outer membrane protein [Bacteroidales bacterium]|jgi:hypothetical protein|nr:RagB/SusD family nutrient uptake outer membrane protein [Bacteroidales bacterium]